MLALAFALISVLLLGLKAPARGVRILFAIARGLLLLLLLPLLLGLAWERRDVLLNCCRKWGAASIAAVLSRARRTPLSRSSVARTPYSTPSIAPSTASSRPRPLRPPSTNLCCSWALERVASAR